MRSPTFTQKRVVKFVIPAILVGLILAIPTTNFIASQITYKECNSSPIVTVHRPDLWAKSLKEFKRTGINGKSELRVRVSQREWIRSIYNPAIYRSSTTIFIRSYKAATLHDIVYIPISILSYVGISNPVPRFNCALSRMADRDVGLIFDFSTK